jgi:hypothetical protein
MHSLNIASQAAIASSGGLYALEVTAKDITQVEASKTEIPQATPINIAFLGNEDHAQRVLANDYLPKPRILHPWPNVRFTAKHPR